MVLVFVMNIVAVILIIVDVKGYPNIIDMPGKAHPIVGFATLFCVVLNVSKNITESRIPQIHGYYHIHKKRLTEII